MTEGRIGQAPEWYLLLKAADRCNVPPWVMEDAPLEWVFKALAATSAEGAAARTAQGGGDRRNIAIS